ncbi:hypothetical protein UFOVP1155_14 [uncultured Caudovirales phage]|uniref:Uncharacterized protein n=1 Tax=uncultured Caudovirales phage TaxID=2100421 RepID=A0A6J5R113_9CAUD|nr:hypothetical protein UFOVP1155_14 [uncultured Caudovirales phage]
MAYLTIPRQRFWGNSNELLAGGKVYCYAAGTSTPQATYSDYALTTPNTWPVVLDSKGEASIWTSGSVKFNVTDANDVQITGYPVDHVGASTSALTIDVHAATSKATPVDADELFLVDSAASFGLKKLTWANLVATLLATWKDATGGLVGMTLLKINFKNAANTFTSFLANANTAARTYTFPDYDGTMATVAGTETLSAKKSSLVVGAVGTPSLYFAANTTTGLYNIGANNDGYAVSGVKVLDIASTGLTVAGTVSANAATAAGHAVRADQIQTLSVTAFTTAGTSTAYTLTPTPAIAAYAANQAFDVIFNIACGAAPTITISGVATPPNLVRQNNDGSYSNLTANAITAGWQSKVKLVSASQALVMQLPMRAKTIPGTRDMTAVTGSVAYTGVGFKPRKITALACVIGTLPQSFGVGDVANQCFMQVGTSYGYNATAPSFLIGINSTTAGAGQIFAITSMDTDGFTGTWTKVATPAAGTCTLEFFCEE